MKRLYVSVLVWRPARYPLMLDAVVLARSLEYAGYEPVVRYPSSTPPLTHCRPIACSTGHGLMLRLVLRSRRKPDVIVDHRPVTHI